jgi:hypothetical protein
MKKAVLIVIFLGVIFTGSSYAQKLEGYNGFEFGMSRDAARFICDVRDYFVDTNFTYDRDAQIPPSLSESFIYYRDSLTVNDSVIPLDVTLYFDNFNGDKLFNIDVSIKYPVETLTGSQKYFDTILSAMKEKYGTNYRYSTEKDTTRLINTLFQRKFRVYDWDMDNGRVSLEHDVSSFYELDEDFYYTDKLKDNGYLEVTIFYFDTKMFHQFMDSKGKTPDMEPDMKDKL